VDPVPDPLLLRKKKSGSAGNRTRTSGSVARNFDHWTTEAVIHIYKYKSFNNITSLRAWKNLQASGAYVSIKSKLMKKTENIIKLYIKIYPSHISDNTDNNTTWISLRAA
jgi:hypothetical protein